MPHPNVNEAPDGRAPIGRTTYHSNNSGGHWWLDDDAWVALEAAGWVMKWGESYFCAGRFHGYGQKSHAPSIPCPAGTCPGHWCPTSAEAHEHRYMGALAREGYRDGLTLAAAITEWERLTRQNSADLGCSCCGTPHSFAFDGEDGSRDHYSPEYPTTGTRYAP